jgi:hypothetical protein
LDVSGRTVVITGRWLRIASVRSEDWLQGEVVPDPDRFIDSLRQSSASIDLFTFAQKLPNTEPAHAFYTEWDNVAAVRTDSFKDWWEKRLPQETRKNVRRAERRGVVVRSVELTDDLVRGLKDIYDETPVRQGRRFWHYGKDLDVIKNENSSYLDRSELLGAFHESELIGFLKMVYVGKTANIMQVVGKNAHADKRPMNALLAKAVEMCAEKGVSFFIYGQYTYGNESPGQLTEFKKRNGFEKILLPRYYVPLTAKGRLALRLGLHRGTWARLPGWLRAALLDLRARYYQKTLASETEAAAP